jgi:TonB-dependent starch-binding outer membrane protein SusC
MFFSCCYGFAQEKGITGIVVDASNEPIMGASVSVQGTTNGTITDINGNFTLKGVRNNAKLQITYVGYVTQILSVDGQSAFKVVLKEASTTLNEVVVVGYGTMKKSDLTGSMSRVTSKEIENRPVQNALQAMQGTVAGADITTNSRPGELGSIRIRGNRSLLADNTPLYVIDGIPMEAGSMADVNPNDIESMEILKDASATAIYGSRGANGVVLISTKKGKEGRVSINYDASFSWSNLHSVTNYMKAGQLLDYNRQSAITGGTYNGTYGTAPDPDRDRALWLGTDTYMDRVVKSAYKYDSNGNLVMRASTAAEQAEGYAAEVPEYDSSSLLNTDWGKLATRTAFTQNHQLSLSAGTDKSKLYFSLDYLNQQVPMKDQNYKRYSANINGEIDPYKWLKVGMGINTSYSIENYGIVNNSSNTVLKDSYGLAMNLMPYAPAYNEDGTIVVTNSGLSWHNILRNIDSAWNEFRYASVLYTSFAEAQVLPWLKWRTNLGAQFRNSRYGSFYGKNWSNPYQFDNTAPEVGYNEQSTKISWTLENLIYIDKTFNKIHKFNITLMQSAERYRTEGLNVRAYDIVYPTSLWYDLGDSEKDLSSYGSSYSTWSRASYMGRINYSLMDRYLITLTGRYDGASVLAKGHKWDFFPSAALAWKINDERFMKNLTWIDQLKLRVGYGVTGNSAISPYQTAGSVTSTYGDIPFGAGNVTANTTGTKTDVMPNTELTWEKTASTNFGVDFGVLNGRISGTIEYYIANTSDLLMNRSLPAITGYGQVKDNIGKTQNKGLEVTLTTQNIKTKDFSWTTDWTFGINKNKIKSLASGVTSDTSNLWFVGSPINVFWDYKYDRIWQNTADDKKLMAVYAANGITFLPGQYKIKDQDYIEDDTQSGASGWTTKTITVDGKSEQVTYKNNGFGKFDSNDKVIYKRDPKWDGGVNNTFKYKDFTLNFFTFFRFGNEYYGLTQTIGRRVEHSTWSTTNTGAKFAQPTTATRTTAYDYVRNYTKGNMVIVRNIALSYDLTKHLTKYGLQSAQIYAQVLNPFLFGGELVKAGINPDDITGWDNTSHIGGQTNNTCITRSFVLGIRIGL